MPLEELSNMNKQNDTARFPAKIWKKLSSKPELLALTGFVVLFIVMIFVSDRFLSVKNLSNVGRQVSINAIIAVGMTMVIFTGGIDLSVGAVMALAGTFTAGAMLAGMHPWIAVSLGLLTGILAGTINGLLVAYGKMPAFIVTLAMMEVPRGIGLLYTNGYPQSGLPEKFAFIGRGSTMGMQNPILIMIIVYIIAYLALNKRAFGRYVYAIGGNEEAVRLSGIKVKIYKMAVYVVSGFTAALSGVVMTSRLMSGQPNGGIGFELDAIAAVILGGTDIAGGRGSIIGTLIGALTLGVLNNGLNLLGVSPYMQKVFKGLIIVLAIYLSSSRERRKSN
ncbi:MAG: ABC transporter permease [Spartobacteria bacterium]|nr:ABC transporter permease [Spartobacteria bacterium]